MARVRQIVAAALTAVAVLGTAACAGGGTDPRASATFAPRPTTGLASMLETPPKYSDAGTSEWSKNYTPTLTQFVDKLYNKAVRARITAALTEQRLQEVAHVLWITDDDIQNDIVVLRFADTAGASARFRFVQSTNNGNGELGSYRIDGPGTPIVFFDNQPQERNFKSAKAYAQLGTYVVEMFVYAPGEIPRMQIQRWLTGQLDKLA